MVARRERKAATRPPSSRAGAKANGLRVRPNSEKKSKVASIKNQIRSIQRLLAKPLPLEVKEAQEQRLEELKKQAVLHQRSELERKMALRYHKVKFFERRKIERSIRRLEKLQKEAAEDTGQDSAKRVADIAEQLADLKEDLEYVRFFPKTEKYVSLFVGNDDENVIAKRQELREQIKANLAAAAASVVELEETGDEDVANVDISEDDFFLDGNLDGSDAEDEFTDKSSRLGNYKNKLSVSKQHGNYKDNLFGVSKQRGNYKDSVSVVSKHSENQQQRKKQSYAVHVFNHESKHNFRSDIFKQQNTSTPGFLMLSKNDNGKAKSFSSSSRTSNMVHKCQRSNHSASNNSNNDIVTRTTVDSSISEKQKRCRKRRPKKKK